MNNFNNQTSSPEKKQVEVKIGNFKYNLTTTESEEYINGIAKYINNKIDEISTTHRSINKDTIPFFLTMALNIADDLFKQRKQFTKSSKSLKTLEENFSKINEVNLNNEQLKNSLEKKNLEIEYLKNEFSKNLNKKEQELASLKEEFNNINKIKDKKISDLKGTIGSLEKKIQEFTSNEDELLNLLCEKEEELTSLKQKNQ